MRICLGLRISTSFATETEMSPVTKSHWVNEYIIIFKQWSYSSTSNWVIGDIGAFHYLRISNGRSLKAILWIYKVQIFGKLIEFHCCLSKRMGIVDHLKLFPLGNEVIDSKINEILMCGTQYAPTSNDSGIKMLLMQYLENHTNFDKWGRYQWNLFHQIKLMGAIIVNTVVWKINMSTRLAIVLFQYQLISV